MPTNPWDMRFLAILLLLVVIVALLAVVAGKCSTAAENTRACAELAQRTHRQLANIAGMLLRAGFRPAPRGRDWFDDASRTQVRGQGVPFDTQVDPFAPWHGRE